MSALFIVLALVALVALWVRTDRTRYEHAVWMVLILMGMGMALSACSNPEAGATSTTMGEVKWTATQDKGTLYLEVEVLPGAQVEELTLTLDRSLDNMAVRDHCVEVTRVQDNRKSTWMLAVEGNKALLINISASPLGVGKHELVMEYRMHRDNQDASLDYWTTPGVVECKATK